MYKNILLGVDTQLKNEKALKEVSKLAGEGTVVTVLNAISEQDAQASIKAGVHLNKLTEERSKRLEKTRKALEDTKSLGISVGDFVSFDPRTVITSSGFIKSR
ncbi:universal stress protein, partial [Staphylococcus aureus]|uniref:universal stress protein n=1 Tax=Staphylococcus aureus TaxID=1280 RepID=UPI003D01B3D7